MQVKYVRYLRSASKVQSMRLCRSVARHENVVQQPNNFHKYYLFIFLFTMNKITTIYRGEATNGTWSTWPMSIGHIRRSYALLRFQSLCSDERAKRWRAKGGKWFSENEHQFVVFVFVVWLTLGRFQCLLCESAVLLCMPIAAKFECAFYGTNYIRKLFALWGQF